jgi:hypothetical protein
MGPPDAARPAPPKDRPPTAITYHRQPNTLAAEEQGLWALVCDCCTFERAMFLSELRRSRRRLAWVYVAPDPVASDGEHRQYHHLDLADLSDAQLWRERERVRLRLVLEGRSHAWFTERYAACRVEGERRR